MEWEEGEGRGGGERGKGGNFRELFPDVCFVSQMFQSAAELLKFTMAGFGVQEEPYFTDKLNNSVTSLFKALKDPSLPLMEMQVWCVEEGGGQECACVCVHVT